MDYLRKEFLEMKDVDSMSLVELALVVSTMDTNTEKFIDLEPTMIIDNMKVMYRLHDKLHFIIDKMVTLSNMRIR